MDLKSGHLYFINEQDVRTGEKSNYYKIGIVYDDKGRDSTDRLLEHQTGNPRQLHIVCLLYTSPSPRDRTRSRMPSSA